MTLLIVLFVAQLFFLIYVWIKLKNLQSKISKAQIKYNSTTRKKDNLLYDLYLSYENKFGSRQLPYVLRNVPFADKNGLVLSVKKVSIPSIRGAFNGSIGDSEAGYQLFFRFDTPICPNEYTPFYSRIGCIPLGRNFEPSEDQFSTIDTQSATSEDARFFENDGTHYLIYNDLISKSSDKRCLHIAQINLKTKSLNSTTPLPLRPEITDKNWTPFSYREEIYFLHTISPQIIFKLPDSRKNQLDILVSSQKEIDWPKIWGALRGGTPAKLVDGEYLSFFHSSFEDNKGIIWYVMGAYTFKASYPFEITRISSHPILFEGIYSTIHESVANLKVRAIYPTGFVIEQCDQKVVIHVSCGENDSGIKIVSLDKNALLASLKII